MFGTAIEYIFTLGAFSVGRTVAVVSLAEAQLFPDRDTRDRSAAIFPVVDVTVEIVARTGPTDARGRRNFWRRNWIGRS